ncbi:filaggrin-like isoform X2 [Arachis ipaensis]|nr:filaggrin-like isoform X2 [Arachis ipaensis]
MAQMQNHICYISNYTFSLYLSSPRRVMASKAHESGSRHHESRRSSTDSRHHDNSRYHDRQPSSKSTHSKHHDTQHSSSRSNGSKHHESQHSSRSDSSRHHVTQHSSRSNGSKHHESQHSSRSSASRYHESQHSSRPDSSRYHESQYSSQHSSRTGGSRCHESQHSSRHHESQYSSMRHQEGQYSSRYHENQNSSRLSRSYSSVLQGSQSSSSSIKNTGIKKNQIVLPDRFHEHALTMMSAAREPFRCSGCKEQGFGRSYRCENKGCRYVLHEECANAVLHRKNHVSHSFFEGQEFWFLEKPLGYPRVCDACRMDVRGFVYHRKATKDVYDTGLDLHPCCLKLRYKISYNDSNATKTLTLRRNVEKKCVKCKSRKVGDDSKVKGWSYLTSDGDCFHVSCFKELFLEKIRDDYFSEKKIVVSKMQSNVVESNMKVVKVGGGSSNNSKGSSSLAKIVVVKIAPVVVKLIFSAIFGDPVSFVLALVEALVTSFN